MTRSLKNKKAMTAAQRREIIEAIDRALFARDKAADAYAKAKGDKKKDLAGKLVKAQKKLLGAYKKYQDGLPRVAISRCPFTGETIHYAIDTFGLNGPWWNYEVPIRPVDETGPTVFAITGAVQIKGTTPKLPFMCKPGPEVPYVVPRLLVDSRVKAVVYKIKVGGYDAYPVVYFSEDTPFDLARINSWGLDYYMAEFPTGEGYSVTVPDLPIDFEPELEFYIRTGRLLWISPDDDDLTLRSTVEDCPYIGIEGRQYPVGLLDGKIWNSLVEQDADLFETPLV